MWKSRIPIEYKSHFAKSRDSKDGSLINSGAKYRASPSIISSLLGNILCLNN